MRCSHQQMVDAWERLGARAEVSPELQEHAHNCVLCSAQIEEIKSMRALVAELPTSPLSSVQVDQMRSVLLAHLQESPKHLGPERQKHQAPSRAPLECTTEKGTSANDDEEATPPSRLGGWIYAVATVLIFGFGFGVRGWMETHPVPVLEFEKTPPQPVYAGFWIAENNAQVERVSTEPNEVVWMRHGAAWFQVEPLPKGKVFKVIAGDSEVDVVGTRFRVDVEGGRLRSVQVAEGRVIVRTQGQKEADLKRGDHWTSPAFRERSNTETTPNPTPITSNVDPTMHSSREEYANAPSVEVVGVEPVKSHPTPRQNMSKRLRPLRKKRRWSVERSSTSRSTSAQKRTEYNIQKKPLSDPSQSSSPKVPVRSEKQPRAQSVDERFAKAWSLYQTGDFEAALHDLEQISERPQRDSVRHAEILYWTARAHLETGSKKRAVDHLKRSLRLSPDGWWADDARRLLRSMSMSPE